MAPTEFTAPTAITLSPSDGAMMWPQSLARSLPAELQTTMPLPTARSAATVQAAVAPSMSAKTYQSL